jgi:hypothetical protein
MMKLQISVTKDMKYTQIIDFFVISHTPSLREEHPCHGLTISRVFTANILIAQIPKLQVSDHL